ncbi:MAG TPA: hypothetical protein VGD87_02200, partial [Archangium sp.]
MKILTWNVLHRTHAETHQEPACTRWPNERERIEQSVVLLREAMRECRVALLQEVSGDLLAAIHKAMPERAIIEHAYPRVPKQRVPSESLKDSSDDSPTMLENLCFSRRRSLRSSFSCLSAFFSSTFSS